MKSKNIKNKNDQSFNYLNANKILADISLDTFFNQNTVPSLKRYPNLDSFKHGFVSLNEKLFKEAKKKEEQNLKRNHLLILEEKPIDKLMKHKIGRSAIKYLQSHSIIRVFNTFYNLFEYHHFVFDSYPEIFEKYFRTIFTIFSSLKKKNVERMFMDICSNSKMHDFYTNLYKSWEEEMNNVEKEEFIQEKGN